MTHTAAAVATTIVTLGLAASAQAAPVLSFTTGFQSISVGSQQDYTVGWSFTAKTTSVVIALDALDPGQTGQEVRLYQGDGTVIASAKVTTGDQQAGTPQFYSHPIAPVTLAANTTYYISQDLPAGLAAWAFVDAPVSTDPAISFEGAVGVLNIGGKPVTDELSFSVLDPAYFGPNFDLAMSSTEVPEPADILAFAAGLAGLIFVRRGRVSPSALVSRS